ncbi:12465_t:CDS:10 [Acaulospora colombiana]|uniref:12465_t:CDS:1 n=1 Tax=Acaulospora colombiana TaxID=27376 RepID=A0ACA9LJF0_9GLOM|nr:12465_t:CDS:10 [Acaulospora colombiana]
MWVLYHKKRSPVRRQARFSLLRFHQYHWSDNRHGDPDVRHEDFGLIRKKKALRCGSCIIKRGHRSHARRDFLSFTLPPSPPAKCQTDVRYGDVGLIPQKRGHRPDVKRGCLSFTLPSSHQPDARHGDAWRCESYTAKKRSPARCQGSPARCRAVIFLIRFHPPTGQMLGRDVGLIPQERGMEMWVSTQKRGHRLDARRDCLSFALPSSPPARHQMPGMEMWVLYRKKEVTDLFYASDARRDCLSFELPSSPLARCQAWRCGPHTVKKKVTDEMSGVIVFFALPLSPPARYQMPGGIASLLRFHRPHRPDVRDGDVGLIPQKRGHLIDARGDCISFTLPSSHRPDAKHGDTPGMEMWVLYPKIYHRIDSRRDLHFHRPHRGMEMWVLYRIKRGHQLDARIISLISFYRPHRGMEMWNHPVT